ncbi:ATP-dependent DNA ligase [Vulgatibacter sp.]|uniref:ATP-dependent DNA ligase n=1 Tax=Vulgatibacter sp. TaxID=1971226 RepID=UPI00356AE90D
MAFALQPPIDPMLARLAEEIPRGDDLVYEPKWDGFRTLVYRDGERLHLQSRNGQPMERYFPELHGPLLDALPDGAVVDGELVVGGPTALDFDALLLRIHPAASRIEKLSRETPASFVAFDLLAAQGRDLRALPFEERRRRLASALRTGPRILLTPQTADPHLAARWFSRFEGAGLDGVIAKKRSLPYVAGERVMWKIKHERTAECVVGGYRKSTKGEGVASLLLGLYDGSGVLHYVGHTSAFPARERKALLERLRPFEGGHSFGAGRTPGGPSRWSRGRDLGWIALEAKLVCEVRFDQLQGNRFRHAARFLRWRPDRDPASCTFEQLAPPRPFQLRELERLAADAAAHPGA